MNTKDLNAGDTVEITLATGGKVKVKIKSLQWDWKSDSYAIEAEKTGSYYKWIPRMYIKLLRSAK